MYDINDKQKAIQAIIASDKEFLASADIAPILGVDPHTIRLVARQRPQLLKFEFIVSGNRTKIPRIPFLKYIGINVDALPPRDSSQEKRNPYEYVPLTNEDLLAIFTQELNECKEEINRRFDRLEIAQQDINSILQAARIFFNTLSGTTGSQHQ